MTTFTAGKSSPNKSDTKNASLAMKSRQQVINEVNKRRTLLQDNSWIKKRPEEENADENYGKVVLNQYKSQDSLHRNAEEKDDQKALLNRYRSDTTLDRISGSSNADKVNKLPVLDGRPSNSKGSDISGTTGGDTSPVKKKRQSWMPPPVSSQKPLNDNAEEHERAPSTSDKSGGPKMIVYSSDPVTSPKPNAVVNDPTRTRQICPPKPSESVADKTATAERTGRRQDLDHLIEVKAKGDKSDKRGRDLDDVIDANNTAQKNRRSQELDDLIVTKSSPEDQNKKRRQDLDHLIEVKAKGDKSDKRHQDLDDLIRANGHEKGGRDLDDLIDVNNTAQKNRRSQGLDDLIVTKSSTEGQIKKRTSGQGAATANIPGNQSDKTQSHQVTKGLSYNGSSPKNTIVYTRTYENSSLPRDAYEDSVSGKSIKTVYSTSDRAIIDKEMCTYCRKPLGVDTKMILDALQICCHATCFKCEVCKGPLETLKAGDSIWIYKNTVHCSPCYSDVKASWVY